MMSVFWYELPSHETHLVPAPVNLLPKQLLSIDFILFYLFTEINSSDEFQNIY